MRHIFFWLKSNLEAIYWRSVSWEDALLPHVVLELDTGEQARVGDVLKAQLKIGDYELPEGFARGLKMLPKKSTVIEAEFDVKDVK